MSPTLLGLATTTAITTKLIDTIQSFVRLIQLLLELWIRLSEDRSDSIHFSVDVIGAAISHTQ
jgi:hypothetical protein